MRRIVIEYSNGGFLISDSDGQWVSVEYDNELGKALFVSELHGDSEPEFGSSKLEDAEAEALFLMGITPSGDKFQ